MGPKLIVCLRKRITRPYFSLSTVYVLASRVKEGAQLRVIGLDPQRDSIDHLTSLVHPAVLGIWEASYHGHAWSADKCQTAIDTALGGESPTPLDELADELADDDMEPADDDPAEDGMDMEPTVADGVDM